MEEHHEPSETPETTESSSEQYLTFELGAESYGIEILKTQEVQEVNERLEITPVPKTPRCLEGVANLRGKIIPILSLRTLFEMESKDFGARASIIVTQPNVGGEPVTLGLLVDEASEVVRVPRAKIEKPTLLSGNRTFDFIEGIARVDERIVCLLTLERLLTEVEQAAVCSALEVESASEDETRDRESELAEVSS